MYSQEAFIRLYDRYQITSVPTSVTCRRKDVANLLNCTERNANMVLKKLESERFIEWTAGRGRGNVSRLTFLTTKDDVVISLAQHRVREGNLRDGFRIVEDNGLSFTTKQTFSDWVFAHLGYRSVPTPNEVNDHHDVLRIPFYRPLASLSPAFVTRRTEAHIVQQVFDTLLRVNAETQELVPHLAHHYESDDTYMKWKFYLRKGVYFHNGARLTAADVAESLENLRAESSPHHPLFEGVSSIKVRSNLELEVQLAQADVLFPHRLAQTAASIQPRKDANRDGQLIGTGPFSLRQIDENMIVLEAFQSYFLGRPQLDRIEIWILPEEPSRLTVAATGGLHYAPRLLGEEYAAWRKVKRIETGCKYLTFNLSKTGPQQEASFRRWIASILNPVNLLADTNRSNQMAHSFVPLEASPHDVTPSLQRRCDDALDFDVRPYGGQPLYLLTYDMPEHVSDATWMKERLEMYGLQVVLKVARAQDVNKETLSQADMALSGEVFDNDIILAYLTLFLTTTSLIRNHLGRVFQSDISQALTAVLREPLTFEERLSRMRQLEQTMQSDHALLFLYHLDQTATLHPTLQGAVMNSLGWLDYRKLWFQPERTGDE